MNTQGFMTGGEKHCTESEGAEMKEYIDRAKAINAIRQYQYPYGVEFLLANIPAADVVEVRHGRWIGLEYDGYADGCPVYDLWECSECGEEVRGEDVPATHPWCHSCGARMDKEDEP